MLATQIEVSDGTLHIINVGIEFFEQADISVALDQSDPLVEGVDYVWSDLSAITFQATLNTPGGFVPNGVEVILRRKSKEDEMYNVYDGGAPFSRSTLDENFQQLLFLSQEFSEGLGFDGLRNNLNMNGYKVTNLGDPSDAADAVNLQYLQAQMAKTLRTPENIQMLPNVAGRASRLLGFNDVGEPVVVAPISGSAEDLALLLAGTTGAGQIGTPAGTVQSILDHFGDPSSPLYGAGMIARNGQVVPSITALRALDKTAESKHAFVTGYYAQGDGGGGMYYLDEADVVSADNGGSVIVATDGGRWKLLYSGVVTAKQFGLKGDGASDDTARMQVLRDWYAGLAIRPRLSFQAGRYLYSVSPNWGISDSCITADGIVYFRNTGTGHSVIVDGGAVSGGIFNMQMGHTGKFIVEGGAGSKDGVYVRSILQGSHLGFQTNGAGTTYSGMRVEFGVCARIDFTCSNNTQGFTWYSRPQYGLFLTRRSPGELCSYCYFPNLIIEGTSSTGVHMDWAQGNLIESGTIEGIASVGVFLTANAIKNKIIATDFEVNTDHDIFCQGRGNEFIGLNTETQITLTGAACVTNRVLGGSHSKILHDALALNNLVAYATYNQNADGSTISDLSGGKLRVRDNYNQGIGRLENVPPASPISIGVGASPFTFTNLGVNEVDISVSSGTVTNISIVRNGVTINMGAISGMFRLTPQDAIVLTYSAGLPVMTEFTR
jgi:hypothetical protein